MGYIKSSEEKPFMLSDFYNGTKFLLRSSSNNYKICKVLLERYVSNLVTTVEVTVWDSLNGYGRHVLTINEASSNINMKSLLLEISEKFAHHEFDETDCYIEATVYMEKGEIEKAF